MFANPFVHSLSIATAQIEAFKLDGTTVQVLFEFITTESFAYDNRLSVALILKNLVKKVYGVSTITSPSSTPN